MSNQTLFDKIWNSHVIHEGEDRSALLYVNKHFIHEVTSPQAFAGLKSAGRRVRRPDLTFATMDHNVSTDNRIQPIKNLTSKIQINTLEKNCKEHNITLFDMNSEYQGIVHVIGPELGLALPGDIIVCGDSHTSTNGALGAFAFGIGTSDVEHVLATQCIWFKKPKNYQITLNGEISYGVTAKDVVLSIIKQIGIKGGVGSVIEYNGSVIKQFSLEERMSICNMSIEAGARAGLIVPDDETIKYISNKKYTPKAKEFEKLLENITNLKTDNKAKFDKTTILNCSKIEPQVTWGTNPAMISDITGIVPNPKDFKDIEIEKATADALEYMDLKPGTPITDIEIDRVFIGSCTNSRLSDLIAVANIIKGKKVNSNVRAMIVPGSQSVKREAENLGLEKIFQEAGFEWRNSGCSMCLGMNDDILAPQERCASTSNRNFEGRQGAGGRTHLVSPIMAAAAAIEGRFIDIREWA